jgi:hypothetical protein
MTKTEALIAGWTLLSALIGLLATLIARGRR